MPIPSPARPKPPQLLGTHLIGAAIQVEQPLRIWQLSHHKPFVMLPSWYLCRFDKANKAGYLSRKSSQELFFPSLPTNTARGYSRRRKQYPQLPPTQLAASFVSSHGLGSRAHLFSGHVPVEFPRKLPKTPKRSIFCHQSISPLQRTRQMRNPGAPGCGGWSDPRFRPARLCLSCRVVVMSSLPTAGCGTFTRRQD